jgi:molybdenum cofactor biosynthesis enzyme MoaA
MANLEISSLSVMVGSPACNLRCPFCISKQTYRVGGAARSPVSLERIAFLADKYLRVCAGLPYGIITGKGEPTLVPPEEIGDIIEVLYAGGRGLIPELQTNGTLLDERRLALWKAKGLNTLALSCVSHRDEVNQRLLSDGIVGWSLDHIVRIARELGLLLRLTAVLVRGGLDTRDELAAFIDWSAQRGVHQLTFRRLGEPRQAARAGSEPVAAWIRANRVEPDTVLALLAERGHEQPSLPWARAFTCQGMSVVVTDGLTQPQERAVRHAVIQPDGHLYGSWDDPGHILA